MGYSFLPVAGGNVLGGLLSGQLYGKLSDKYTFLRNYLIDHGLAQQEDIAGQDNGVLFRNSLNQLQLTGQEMNRMLYDMYQPGKIWLIFGAIGLFTALVLFLYNRFLLNRPVNSGRG
jgi:hypothetical protein